MHHTAALAQNQSDSSGSVQAVVNSLSGPRPGIALIAGTNLHHDWLPQVLALVLALLWPGVTPEVRHSEPYCDWAWLHGLNGVQQGLAARGM
jgi:hypothetical protein